MNFHDTNWGRVEDVCYTLVLLGLAAFAVCLGLIFYEIVR